MLTINSRMILMPGGSSVCCYVEKQEIVYSPASAGPNDKGNIFFGVAINFVYINKKVGKAFLPTFYYNDTI